MEVMLFIAVADVVIVSSVVLAVLLDGLRNRD
jgi:hypothetical protein